MRTTKKKKGAPAYKVGDKVATAQGEGRIVGVFSSGPHRKATYTVKFPRRRVGVVFDENEISVIGRITSPGREPD
jgi:hypothetical protein